jgi:hypothetical protein
MWTWEKDLGVPRPRGLAPLRRAASVTALGRVACVGGSVLAFPRKRSDRFAPLSPLTLSRRAT